MSTSSSSLPEWLSKESLQKIFYSKLNRKCRVVSVDYGQGSKSGDNYLSEVTRLTVTIQEGNREDVVFLIVKNPYKGFYDFLDEVNGIAKETEVYTELVPFANVVLKNSVCADCFFVSSDNCLVLQDLCSDGYRNTERRDQLDFHHARTALKSLAEFHAVAIKFLETSPDSLGTARQETMFTSRNDTIICHLHKHLIKTAIDSIKSRADGLEFVESLEAFSKSFRRECREAILFDYDFKTLNQGDYWSSNILFKYRDDEVIHSKILDFQLTKLTTPCYDIHFLIATSIRSEVRDRSMDILLDEYLHTLNTTLKEIGSDRTLDRAGLDEAMDRSKVIGIFFALYLSPLVLLDPSNAIDLDSITNHEILSGFENSEQFNQMCSDHKFLDHVISLLKYYRRKNYI